MWEREWSLRRTDRRQNYLGNPPSVTLSTTKYCPTSSCRMGGVQAYTAWRSSWDICRSPTAALAIRVYFELDSPETRCWNLYGDNRLTPLSLSFLFCKWAY